MASAPSTAALLFIQGLDLHPRRFLLHNPLYGPSASSPTASTNPKGLSASRPCTASSGFDTNVVMILSVLLCALICSLGLNTLIRCAIRCSSFAAAGPNLSHHQQGQNPAAARVANTGIKRKALKTFPTVVHSPDLKLPGLSTECVICLSEFLSGDRVRLLPKCNHGFHVRCIDLWLSSHSSCPTCRNCLIETCEKIAGCGEPSSSRPAAVEARLPEGAVVINMAPLQREGLVRS